MKFKVLGFEKKMKEVKLKLNNDVENWKFSILEVIDMVANN